MNESRSKWIRRVVFSKHPVVLDMIEKKLGEEKANKLTYKQVIKVCKKMWLEQTPGVEKWEIYEQSKEI